MKRNKQKQMLKYTVLASMLAAITAVLTFYIKIPSHNGYIHLGDSVIYLAAVLLPAPFAMVCAGLGGMLADVLGGYTLYILPTFIIKMLITLPFSSKNDRMITKRNIVALPIASLITTAGYYIAEAVLVSLSATGSSEQFFSYLLSPAPWTASLYTIPGNIMQAVGSALIFIPLAIALDKIKIKSKI